MGQRLKAKRVKPSPKRGSQSKLPDKFSRVGISVTE